MREQNNKSILLCIPVKSVYIIYIPPCDRFYLCAHLHHIFPGVSLNIRAVIFNTFVAGNKIVWLDLSYFYEENNTIQCVVVLIIG